MPVVLFTLVVCVCACGSGASSPDAAVVGDGRCGAELDFTGEIVDWDATDAMFCGVSGATLRVRNDASRTDQTNPNGRFELCIPRSSRVQLDLVPPAASGCGTGGPYQFSGILVADQSAIATGKLFSARMIGATRAGSMFDPTKAVVFVHSEGVIHPVTSSAAHGGALAWNGAQWQPGNSGVNVVFPNIDPGSATTVIGVASGTAIGTGSVPVEAGKFTYVTIVGN